MATGKTPDRELASWLTWSRLLTGRQLRKLFDRFVSGEAAWRASAAELRSLGLEVETVTRILEERARLDPAALLDTARRLDLEVTTLKDPAYPALLREAYDAPALLFSRGQLPRAEERLLAIVGTRRPTAYGQAVTVQLTRELARAGLTIVSGLARGIDALAHQTTLEAGGRTAAVLGSGLADADVYPREHLSLARRIVSSGGALLAEYPPGTGPERHHFPERNRIIAGLCPGVLVIEAPETSGALITAKLALEYDREVMAVPGSILEPNAAGTNSLLALGARPVTSADDVLETLNLERLRAAAAPLPDLSPAETAVLAAVAKTPTHIDALGQAVAMDVAALGSALTLLEVKGVIRDVGGKNYVRLA